MVSPKCKAIQQLAYMKSRMGQSCSRTCKTCINCNFAVFVGHEMTLMGYSLEIHGIFIKMWFIVHYEPYFYENAMNF